MHNGGVYGSNICDLPVCVLIWQTLQHAITVDVHTRCWSFAKAPKNMAGSRKTTYFLSATNGACSVNGYTILGKVGHFPNWCWYDDAKVFCESPRSDGYTRIQVVYGFPCDVALLFAGCFLVVPDRAGLSRLRQELSRPARAVYRRRVLRLPFRQNLRRSRPDLLIGKLYVRGTQYSSTSSRFCRPSRLDRAG